jgi:hypothetical protein
MEAVERPVGETVLKAGAYPTAPDPCCALAALPLNRWTNGRPETRLVRRKNRKSTGFFARRTGRGRSVALWLAILALALHGLIPLAQGVPGPRRAGDRPSSLILCVALASKSAPAEDDRAPTDSDRRSCPICQIHALGKSLLPPLVAAWLRPQEWTVERHQDPADHSDSPILRSWRVRAPPLNAPA